MAVSERSSSSAAHVSTFLIWVQILNQQGIFHLVGGIVRCVFSLAGDGGDEVAVRGAEQV